MKTKKKYLMLVFEENSDKSLEFYSDNPYRGRLSDIVYGDNVKELMISSDGHSNEGLFYVLYSAVDGTMISYRNHRLCCHYRQKFLLKKTCQKQNRSGNQRIFWKIY